MSTDTLVTLIAVVFFGSIVLFVVLGIRKAYWLDKHPDQDPERKGMNERILRNAAAQGITQDELSHMTGPQLMDLSWTEEDRFFMAHGLYTGWVLWKSFLPVRPGHRVFSLTGLRIKEAIIYLSFAAAYALGEWTDAVLYRTLPYMNTMEEHYGSYEYLDLFPYEYQRDSISGTAGIVCVLLLCLGMVLLNEKHRRWQRFSFLLVPLWLIGGALFWYWTSFIPSRGSDYYDGHDYNVFKVGWAGMDISQYAWLAYVAITILAVFLVPLIRAHYRKKNHVAEFGRLPVRIGLRIACFFFIPVSVVYALGGGEHAIIVIIICAVVAIADVFIVDNVSDLCDYAHRAGIDAVYEWNAAFCIILSALASVAMGVEGITTVAKETSKDEDGGK